MRVTLAKPRGFCAGVNMAVEALDKALELYGAPVYVYHEIVHNKHVVETFREKGAIFVDRREDMHFQLPVELRREMGRRAAALPAR